MEHSPTDFPQASTMLSCISDISQGRVTPIARVVDGTIHHIKQALDGGAQGIIVPMVNTAEDAQKVIQFARFPPLGIRGVGGLLPHLGFGATRADYVDNANREVLVAVQIETKQAVENVDAILGTPGIDVAFVGPSDLHMSLGLKAALWSDEQLFLEAFRKVKEACTKHGVPLGLYSKDGATARERVEKDGVQFAGFGGDGSFLLNEAGAQAAEARGEQVQKSGYVDMFKGL
eukprot:Phypoly_transcript_12828.p1 GENE.Phypoly_transcript_12828~~Phypoly_transcript_12828.p1  ORF type:complete len:272 (+),score=44.48 Phypoly_transcript_12828:123-818(+)